MTMALIFKEHEPIVPTPPESGFSWNAWYAKNKKRLSEKRAKRYREDAAYREAALKRSRGQRKAKKPEITDSHTVSFNDAALELDRTVWVLREWRRKNYFPEPFRRGGRLWFTPAQVFLLRKLKHLFDQHGVRVTESFRPELESLVAVIYANWK